MNWIHHVAWFRDGAFLTHAVAHVVSGAGR